MIGALLGILAASAVGAAAWYYSRPGEAPAPSPPPPPPDDGDSGDGDKGGGMLGQIEIPPDLDLDLNLNLGGGDDSGTSPDDPTSVPVAGKYYAVQDGDTGVMIACIAYNLQMGSGAPLNAWYDRIVSHDLNRALCRRPWACQHWSGDLVYEHARPGANPRGSGYRLPVVWIPEA